MSDQELALLIMFAGHARRLVEKELSRRGKTEEEILEGALETLGDEGRALKSFLDSLPKEK